MDFDLLFDDLESQLEAQLSADAAQQQAEEERLRAARTSLSDRLAALAEAGAGRIRLQLRDGSSVELEPGGVGVDWLAGILPEGSQAVVPIAAVVSLGLSPAQLRHGRGRMPESPDGAPAPRRVGIGVVLRDLARRRVPVDVVTGPGAVPLHGTIDRVGADHLDLAVHERGAVRRASSVREHRVVALAAVAMIRVPA